MSDEEATEEAAQEIYELAVAAYKSLTQSMHEVRQATEEAGEAVLNARIDLHAACRASFIARKAARKRVSKNPAAATQRKCHHDKS